MMSYVAAHPDVQSAFLSDADIQSIVNSQFRDYYSANQAQNFALEVWTHNALLAGQCLVAGILILPVLYFLAMNLVNLGLVGGVMIGNGKSDVFFGLIVPHGLLELTAVFVAAGVGLRIGWAWIAPGPGRTRGRALAETARAGTLVALGLVMVLLGGIQTLSGPIVGASVFALLQDSIMRQTEYWRALLGGIILLLVLAFPAGIVGGLAQLSGARRMRR